MPSKIYPTLIVGTKIKKMYQIAYASTNHALMSMVEFRRYPILVAYLSHSYTLILDETLDMFIGYVWDCHRKGNKAFEKEIREQYSSKIELIKKLKDICELATDEDEKVLKTKYSSDDFENLISECEKYLRPENDRKWDYFAKRYGNIRKFLPKLLQVIRFESNEQATQVVRALSFIKRADDTVNESWKILLLYLLLINLGIIMFMIKVKLVKNIMNYALYGNCGNS
jgi:hypothetical protein